MSEKKIFDYELMVIIKPMLPENVRMGVESKITELLEVSDGKVLKVDVWGKKHLAYKIATQAEGYYIIYNFQTTADAIESIEKALKQNKDILRYIVINQDK